ncbi:iron-hydroxamate ABC transporter substrate-binding protein [Bacillus sp. AK128]
MFKLNKNGLLIACFLFISILLVGCGNNDEAESTDEEPEVQSEEVTDENTEEATERVLTDALGNEVTVPAKPERVIASYLEDHLVALGVTPVAQWSVADGASVQDYLQEYLKDVETIPYDLPFEAVSSFTPDLIIMPAASSVEGGKYEQYNKIAPTYVIGQETNENWRENLERIAEVFGLEDKATEVLETYEANAEEASATIKEAIGEESAAALWLVGGTFYIVGDTVSSGSVLYQDLGITVPEVVKEISAAATGNWSEISLEKLATLDADHLFLINSDGDGAEALQDSLWQNIPAVKNGNVYEYPAASSWLYSGPIANQQIIDDVVESVTK